MSDLNSQYKSENINDEYPAFTTRRELENAVRLVAQGAMSAHSVIARIGNTDLTAITDADATGRPGLDYTNDPIDVDHDSTPYAPAVSK